MSVTKFGIYLAYQPTVDLRQEGLGRYLAAFLKGAAHQGAVQFVLVCPSWSRDSLESLFDEEQVPKTSFKIISPEGQPALLRLYQVLLAFRRRRGSASRLKRLWIALKQWKSAGIDFFLRRITGAKSMASLAIFLLPIAAFGIFLLLLSPLVALGAAISFFAALFLQYVYRRHGQRIIQAYHKFRTVLGQPKDSGLVLRMYRSMDSHEAQRMKSLIDAMSDVEAWYCPTAFWPAFNSIKKPRLMCVPDVVLSDFPVGFSYVGGDRFLQVFQQVENSIQGGSHFVTYSDSVKYGTLVDRYGVEPSKVAVIHHAPNDLSRWVTIFGLKNPEMASEHYCGSLLINAIRRSTNPDYSKNFENQAVTFLFYASQLRPNKNILTLLRAYEHLLRRRFIGHKLIMTGDPKDLPAVRDFVKEHRLENEVLFLHGLKVQELAACYKLAELAVNPSLSEGGCPFTFTEALSVQTPVVMARIGVTEEVLTDPELQAASLFDPYDWRDMARRIEWALANRDFLLALQLKTYNRLASRTWTNVVSEHLDVLRRISGRTVGA